MSDEPETPPYIQPAKTEFDYMAAETDERRQTMFQHFVAAKKKWVEKCRRDNKDDPSVYNAILRLVEEARTVKNFLNL